MEDLTFIIILDVTMILMDSVVITDLRRLLLDFLIGARNRKSIRKIHKQQPLKERVTLSYIKSYLKQYQSVFQTVPYDLFNLPDLSYSPIYIAVHG